MVKLLRALYSLSMFRGHMLRAVALLLSWCRSTGWWVLCFWWGEVQSIWWCCLRLCSESYDKCKYFYRHGSKVTDLPENKENSAFYSALESESISMDYILYLQTHFKYMHVDMLALSPAKHAWGHRIRGNKKSFCSFERVFCCCKMEYLV